LHTFLVENPYKFKVYKLINRRCLIGVYLGEIKQAIIIRSNLEMSKGKIAAQAAHASLMSYFEAERQDKQVAREWLDTGEKKIVLKVSDEDSLVKLYNAFKFKKVPCALVTDAGLTEIPPGSKTALGIGPWKSEEIDIFTRQLKLL
jgi:PTH2 family peptidyl-tRNA hydrolase